MYLLFTLIFSFIISLEAHSISNTNQDIQVIKKVLETDTLIKNLNGDIVSIKILNRKNELRTKLKRLIYDFLIITKLNKKNCYSTFSSYTSYNFLVLNNIDIKNYNIKCDK